MDVPLSSRVIFVRQVFFLRYSQTKNWGIRPDPGVVEEQGETCIIYGLNERACIAPAATTWMKSLPTR